MLQSITSTDLDDWSRRRDAQSHLPTLVRRLVMATVSPRSIRVPAAEGVSAPGFDGVIDCDGGALPYVPAGRSVWEIGTNHNSNGKAEADYTKRLAQVPVDERAITTFVFVTSRAWDRARDWAATKVAEDDGWAGVVAYDAQDLATWLATCPGVAVWLSVEHLNRPASGITAMRDWYAQWAERTEPAIPAELLTCGREQEASTLLETLLGTPCELLVSTGSRDEAIAFVAATLLTDSRTSEASIEGPGSPPDEYDQKEDQGQEAEPEDAAETGAREALLERTVVVHDSAAWRQWASHESPLVLVPDFDDPPVAAALRAGHTVALTGIARPGGRARAGDITLPSLHRGRARDVWIHAGLPSPQADELARASYRSLVSLRRRIGRAGRFRRPVWTEGETGVLIATLLLAGSWDGANADDRAVVLELSERTTWRGLERALRQLQDGDDAPLRVQGTRWEFADVIDAWDAIGMILASDDLDLFHRLAVHVLGKSDPVLGLAPEQRSIMNPMMHDLTRPAHSPLLRRGMATATAVLGAVVDQRVLGGGYTGSSRAARVVHELLDSADNERWQSLADLLPILAEAAPGTFLDAVEKSLAQPAPAVMTLFDEKEGLGGLGFSSRHTHLLWALETLAFSSQHVSRSAVILGQISELDPGGRLGNRPSASLAAALHIVLPQAAVDGTSRLEIVDSVLRQTPRAGWALLLSLIANAGSGMILRDGPRFRDWTLAPADTTYTNIWYTLDALADRLVSAAGDDGARWAAVLRIVDRLPARGRETVLKAADATWRTLDEEHRRTALMDLIERASRHARHPDAGWALPGKDLQRLKTFIDAHALPELLHGDEVLFSWWPSGRAADPRDLDKQAALRTAREAAVQRALQDGVRGLIELARLSELPGLVGDALAEVTNREDEEVLDLIEGGTPGAAVAGGLVAARYRRDPHWLARQVEAKPSRAAKLLLASDLDETVLSILSSTEPDQQKTFWHGLQPWRVPHALAKPVAEALIAHDRPFSAASVLEDRAEEGIFHDALVLRAVQAPLKGTSERLDAILSPQYLLGRLLTRLDDAGVTTSALADLEWFYLPVLRDVRVPTALYRQLAADPTLFAKLVMLVYRQDDPMGGGGSAHGATSGVTGMNSSKPESATSLAGRGIEDASTAHADDPDQDSEDMVGDPLVKLSEAAWRLLHDWRTPQPGSVDGIAPDAQQMLSWVRAATQALDDTGRREIAPVVIGEALSGPATDEDGIWPSRAVRDVLETIQNQRLEEGLAIGKFNQRGVTVRGLYDGGEQERVLAARFRNWAESVRNDWPRAGALLDRLAYGYEADAQREDESARRSSGD